MNNRHILALLILSCGSAGGGGSRASGVGVRVTNPSKGVQKDLADAILANNIAKIGEAYKKNAKFNVVMQELGDRTVWGYLIEKNDIDLAKNIAGVEIDLSDAEADYLVKNNKKDMAKVLLDSGGMNEGSTAGKKLTAFVNKEAEDKRKAEAARLQAEKDAKARAEKEKEEKAIKELVDKVKIRDVSEISKAIDDINGDINKISDLTEELKDLIKKTDINNINNSLEIFKALKDKGFKYTTTLSTVLIEEVVNYPTKIDIVKKFLDEFIAGNIMFNIDEDIVRKSLTNDYKDENKITIATELSAYLWSVDKSGRFSIKFVLKDFIDYANKLKAQEAQSQTEEEKKVRLQAEKARLKAEEEARLQAEAVKLKAEEEAKLQAEAARLQEEKDAKAKAEAKIKAEEEKGKIEKLRAEAEEARVQAEKDVEAMEKSSKVASAKMQIEWDKAIKRAEEAAKSEAEKARLQEEKARLKAEEEARLQAEAVKLKAEEEDRLQAEEARSQAEIALMKTRSLNYYVFNKEFDMVDKMLDLIKQNRSVDGFIIDGTIFNDLLMIFKSFAFTNDQNFIDKHVESMNKALGMVEENIIDKDIVIDVKDAVKLVAYLKNMNQITEKKVKPIFDKLIELKIFSSGDEILSPALYTAWEYALNKAFDLGITESKLIKAAEIAKGWAPPKSELKLLQKVAKKRGREEKIEEYK